mmetsp:Transcript_27491/g.42925  ORF Transcript_27491/g.42925 Transcript_27491/m.42925 type:complete len:171 (-) Transcript_27491:139-651(-)
MGASCVKPKCLDPSPELEKQIDEDFDRRKNTQEKSQSSSAKDVSKGSEGSKGSKKNGLTQIKETQVDGHSRDSDLSDLASNASTAWDQHEYTSNQSKKKYSPSGGSGVRRLSSEGIGMQSPYDFDVNRSKSAVDTPGSPMSESVKDIKERYGRYHSKKPKNLSIQIPVKK